MTFKAWLLTALLCASPCFACEDSLLPVAQVTVTESFVAYLDVLTDERVVSARELKLLLRGYVPQFVASLAQTRSLSRDIHAKVLKQYLAEPALDFAEVNLWIEQKLGRAQQVTDERQDTRAETEIPLPAFIKIPGGEYPELVDGLGQSARAQVPVRVAPFEVMATYVTQDTWKFLMGRNPSVYVPGYSLLETRVPDGDEIEIAVDSISWWSAAVFANRVSQSHGVQPFYKFEDAQWMQGTRAEDGTLMPVSREEGYRLWKASHPDDFADRPGYRMPLFREWAYLVYTYLGLTGKDFFEGDPYRGYGSKRRTYLVDAASGSTEVYRAGWLALTAGIKRQPLAIEKFAEVPGGRIYGLVGNISEFTDDGIAAFPASAGEHELHSIVVTGGTMMSDKIQYRDERSLLYESRHVGFRLVRSLRDAP